MIELLVHLGVALIERRVLDNEAVATTSSTAPVPIRILKLDDEIRQVYRDLQKWVDLSDEKVSFY